MKSCVNMHRSSIVSFSVQLVLFIASFSVALSAVAVKRGLPNTAASDWPVDDNIRKYIPENWQNVGTKFASSEIRIESRTGHLPNLDVDYLLTVIFRSPVQNRKTMEYQDENTSGNKIEEDVRQNEIAKSDDAKSNDGQAVPQLGSRTVIETPAFQCSDGYKMQDGKCRLTIHTQ